MLNVMTCCSAQLKAQSVFRLNKTSIDLRAALNITISLLWTWQEALFGQLRRVQNERFPPMTNETDDLLKH